MIMSLSTLAVALPFFSHSQVYFLASLLLLIDPSFVRGIITSFLARSAGVNVLVIIIISLHFPLRFLPLPLLLYCSVVFLTMVTTMLLLLLLVLLIPRE